MFASKFRGGGPCQKQTVTLCDGPKKLKISVTSFMNGPSVRRYFNVRTSHSNNIGVDFANKTLL